MASLSWEEADYARGDSNARQALINEYDRQLKLIGQIATGVDGAKSGRNDYKWVIDVVKKNWQGADADAFLSNLERSAQLLKQETEALRTYLARAVNNDAKQFASFQSTMATRMNTFSK